MVGKIYFISAVLVVYLFSPTIIIVAEEIPFSVENNRVVKMFGLAKQLSSPIPKESPEKWNSSSIGTEFDNIVSEVETLKRIVAQIKQMNDLNEIAEKCISSIKRRHESKAQKHWDLITKLLNTYQEESSNVLRKITIEAYDGLRENILSVVHFVNYTKDFSGLSVLLEEMREYGHIYAGTEIFLFAKLIRIHCGTKSPLYQELPEGIRFVDSYSVRLLNENNNGALFYKPRLQCRGKHCTPDEIFTFHLELDDLDDDESHRGTWIFEPTNTTEFSNDIKFNLRNEFGNRSYLYFSYYSSLSSVHKSTVMVHLVNGTEDAIRIRIEQSHLVKRLIMGGKNTGSNTIGLSIMTTEDRLEKANDGNWVVHPVEILRDQNIIKDHSYKCQFKRSITTNTRIDVENISTEMS